MTRSIKNLTLVALAGAILLTSALTIPPVRRLFHPVILMVQGRKTVDERLGEFSAARARVEALFQAADIAFPPKRVVLLGIKDERRLEVYAGPADDALVRIADYPVLAASGIEGPKLREGDRQVPEGIYTLESLNPNSRFHVALRIGYPNLFDKEMAERDGRDKLGSDIMIHGGNASIGCLAMGDPVAEELFVLAAEAGIENVKIILTPTDLRKNEVPSSIDVEWKGELYNEIQQEMQRLR